MFNKKINNRGFSLMETLVSLSILLIVLTGLIFSVFNMVSFNKRADKVFVSNQLIRKLLEQYSSKQKNLSEIKVVTSLLKPEDIDKNYKESSKQNFNNSVRIAVFLKDKSVTLNSGVSLPNSLDKLTWVKVVAYEKDKPDPNLLSFNDLKLISQVTDIIDVN